ncbi:MAG: hypothetical protein O7F71_08690 [Gammaproteobacteria bacterium]|nr:hypothetical protein [Gammaproteobacteria bacterium]
MPVELQREAEGNLRYIRQAMERAEQVSAVSGLGGIGMGGTAIAGAIYASTIWHGEDDLRQQLLIWLVTAVFAITIELVAAYFKSRSLERMLLNDPARRFALCLAPNLIAGALLTGVLWNTPQHTLVPAIWMLSYGCGVLSAGTYAVRPVVLMGGCFVIAGVVAVVLEPGSLNLYLGAVFGGLHIIFGWWVFRSYGG